MPPPNSDEPALPKQPHLGTSQHVICNY